MAFDGVPRLELRSSRSVDVDQGTPIDRERDTAGLFIVGYHTDRFILKKSPADRNYVMPPTTHPRFADTLRRIVKLR